MARVVIESDGMEWNGMAGLECVGIDRIGWEGVGIGLKWV